MPIMNHCDPSDLVFLIVSRVSHPPKLPEHKLCVCNWRTGEITTGLLLRAPALPTYLQGENSSPIRKGELAEERQDSTREVHSQAMEGTLKHPPRRKAPKHHEQKHKSKSTRRNKTQDVVARKLSLAVSKPEGHAIPSSNPPAKRGIIVTRCY